MPIVRKKVKRDSQQTGLMIKLEVQYKQEIFIKRKTILQNINHGEIR